MAANLHGLTKKPRAFPKPWTKGEDYDLSLNSLRSAILDSTNFLHHKDSTAGLFIEVDASDAGWGVCEYRMVESWTGDPAEEGRGRQGGTGARKVIQWTSKAWTAFELKLPVFYRESLARLLALERYEVSEPNLDRYHRGHHSVHKPLTRPVREQPEEQGAIKRLEVSGDGGSVLHCGESVSHRGKDAACRSPFKVLRSERGILRRHSASEDQHAAGKFVIASCRVQNHEGI